jgi:hypothetical protein
MKAPNFVEMSKAELRAYVLENRSDQDAFYALADRISADPNLRRLQPGERLEDVLPEILQRQQRQNPQ